MIAVQIPMNNSHSTTAAIPYCPVTEVYLGMRGLSSIIGVRQRLGWSGVTSRYLQRFPCLPPTGSLYGFDGRVGLYRSGLLRIVE